MKIVFLRSNIAAFLQPCRSLCHLPSAPFPRNCMQSIQFLHRQVYFSVDNRPGQSILPTVLGLPGRRHSRAQFYAPPGLVKLIKTSLGRASPRAFGELKGRQGIGNALERAPQSPGVLSQPCLGILSRWTAKGNDE
jgi:hypothetical protein